MIPDRPARDYFLEIIPSHGVRKAGAEIFHGHTTLLCTDQFTIHVDRAARSQIAGMRGREGKLRKFAVDVHPQPLGLFLEERARAARAARSLHYWHDKRVRDECRWEQQSVSNPGPDMLI